MYSCPLERAEMNRAALARKYPDIFNEVYKDGLTTDVPSFKDIKDMAGWCVAMVQKSWKFARRIWNKKMSGK